MTAHAHRHSVRAGAALLLSTCLAACGSPSGGGGLQSLNGTPLPYSVVVAGGWPTVQTIGTPVDLLIRAQNIGEAVPHLVIVLSGLRPGWKILRIEGCGRGIASLKPLIDAPARDFGPLEKKEMCTISYHLLPTGKAGPVGAPQDTVYVRLFGAVVNGAVGDKVPVNGGMELSATVSP